MFKSINLSKRLFFLLLICLCVVTENLHSQVINEILASNITGLVDEDGDFPDWLELCNNTDGPVNLGDYYLSDDIQDSAKWQFPPLTIESGDYQLVFASGKNRQEFVKGWNTLIDKGDEFAYLVPTQQVDASWKSNAFDDSGWLRANSGFGYGDDDDETQLPGALSVFVRRAFTITMLDDIVQTVLHLDYDDGFVAYINGVEIARDRLGQAGSFVSYNQSADDYNHEAKMYQGGQADVFEMRNWESVLREGENILAIQVHNYSSTSSDLSCIPFLSVGLKKGDVFSGSSHIELPRSYLHSNFKIKAGGESLYFFRNKELLDSVGSVLLLPDVSYGRMPDESNQWSYFAEPTPWRTNGDTGVTELSTDSILFSVNGGVYQNAQQLTLSIQSGSVGKIYYTTDGSVPDQSSILYEDEISIDNPAVIRARAFVAGKLPGPVVTNSYIFGSNHDLPVVSLTTKPDHLWDYQTGIYEMGPNAESDNPHWGANFWQDWERPVNFEFFDKGGECQINQGAGIKIYGAWSRAHPQKSLALFARKEYGDGSFSYKFFDKRENDKFEALVLRNAGNAFYSSHIHDAFMTDMMKVANFETQAFQPVVVYINGQYWGVLNLREKINEHFIANNIEADADEVNILEAQGDVVFGNNDRYKSLLSFITSNSLASDDNYNKVISAIDVDCYVDYQLTQTYIDNRDWPGNNIKFWNTNSPRSQYRWILYDTDFGFGLYGDQNYKHNSLQDAKASNGSGWPNPPWSTLLFRKLLDNSNFKAKMALRANDFLNTSWKPMPVKQRVDSFKVLYRQEMSNHCQRWDLDYNHWQSEVERLKVFATHRPSYYLDYLGELLGYGSTNSLVVTTNESAWGTVKINSLLPSFPFRGDYFSGLSVELSALPKPGFKLDQWRGSAPSDKQTCHVNMANDVTMEAVFTAAVEEDVDVIINEVFYKSGEDIKPSDWVEIYNAGDATVDLLGWTFSDSQYDSAFVFNTSYVLYPEAYLVICKNTQNFKTCYPWVNNVVGEIRFGLSSLGDNLRLYNAEGLLMDAVDYYPTGEWPLEANGGGASLEVIDPGEANEYADNWMASPNGGTPGEQNTHFVDTGVFTPSKTLEAALRCDPNPIAAKSRVSFSIKKTGYYQLDILNSHGQVVQVLEQQVYSAGSHQLLLNRSGLSPLASGLYVLRLSGVGGMESIRIVIVPNT